MSEAGHRPPWLDRLAVAAATLGPVGSLRPGPGTWGTLAGLVLSLLCAAVLPMSLCFALLLLVTALAIPACGRAERALGQGKDPSRIVLDEAVALPWCLVTQAHWLVDPADHALGLLLAFGLFRCFDIAKPLGLEYLQRLRGGLGICADDLVAAVATVGALEVLLHLGRLLGVQA